MRLSRISALSLAAVMAACGSQVVEFPEPCGCPVAVGTPDGGQGGEDGTGGDTGTGGGDTGTGGGDTGTGGTDSGTGGTDSGTGGDTGTGGDDGGTGGSDSGTGGDDGGTGGTDSGTGGSDAGTGGDDGGQGGTDAGTGGSDAGTGGDGGGPAICDGKEVTCNEYKNHGQCVSACAHKCQDERGDHKHHALTCHVFQECFKPCKEICDCIKDACKVKKPEYCANGQCDE